MSTYMGCALFGCRLMPPTANNSRKSLWERFKLNVSGAIIRCACVTVNCLTDFLIRMNVVALPCFSVLERVFSSSVQKNFKKNRYE